MKNEEKKVKLTEEVKPEEKGVQLTDEELSSVAAGVKAPDILPLTSETAL